MNDDLAERFAVIDRLLARIEARVRVLETAQDAHEERLDDLDEIYGDIKTLTKARKAMA